MQKTPIFFGVFLLFAFRWKRVGKKSELFFVYVLTDAG